MNRQRQAFVVLLVVAALVSMAACYPLVNVVQGNPAGWFTMDNLDDYGDDLDERENVTTVFTGHPSYVIDSDDVRLLFDMPRIHYYAITFNDTDLGDEFYARLTRALQEGRAEVAIDGAMTEAILRHNQTAAQAFSNHYCPVTDSDTHRLYNRTHATLYQWTDDADCDTQLGLTANTTSDAASTP